MTLDSATKHRQRLAASKKRIAAGDDSHVTHGTENAYGHYGCRCNECRAAGATASRERRQARP